MSSCHGSELENMMIIIIHTYSKGKAMLKLGWVSCGLVVESWTLLVSRVYVCYRQTGNTGGSPFRALETSVEMTNDFSHINPGMSYFVPAL